MIYVSTSCLKRKYIKDILLEFGENNILNVELSGGTCFYNDIKNDLIDYKQKYNLTYSCHAYFPPPQKEFVVNLASTNDDIYYLSINHYEECVKLLTEIGCDVLSIHAGFMVEITPSNIGKKLNSVCVYNENDSYKRFVDAFNFLKRLCDKNGIELFLENNVLSFENYEEFNFNNYLMMTDYCSIRKMQELIDFNLLLDIAHLNVSSNTLRLSFEEQCRLLMSDARWLHISENNGIFDQHLTLEKNGLIYDQCKKNINKKINVTLETVGDIKKIKESIYLLQEIGYER